MPRGQRDGRRAGRGTGVDCPLRRQQERLRPADLRDLRRAPLAGSLGIGMGYHRLLTHRAFKTKKWVKGMFAIFGSAAIE